MRGHDGHRDCEGRAAADHSARGSGAGHVAAGGAFSERRDALRSKLLRTGHRLRRQPEKESAPSTRSKFRISIIDMFPSDCPFHQAKFVEVLT